MGVQPLVGDAEGEAELLACGDEPPTQQVCARTGVNVTNNNALFYASIVHNMH